MVSPLPFGSWPSPITAQSLVAGAAGVGEVLVDGDDIWWTEFRPEERGRTALVRWRAGATEEPLGPNVNVRTAVHEYGGGAWWVKDETVWFVAWEDQRLQRLDLADTPVGSGAADVAAAVMLTPEPAIAKGLRYADGRATADKAWFLCVRENHAQDAAKDNSAHAEPTNELVAIAGDGSGTVNILVSGPDFVSSPRLSPDGTKLTWIQWNHPDMPWDSTELCIADFADGVTSNHRVVAGGENESILEPGWDNHGNLTAISDRTTWWNLYRWSESSNFADVESLLGGEFETSAAHWVFNESHYAQLGERWAVTATGDGRDNLRISSTDGANELTQWSSVGSLRSTGEVDEAGLVFVGATWSSESDVVRLNNDRSVDVIRAGRTAMDVGCSPAFFPDAEHITFPTGPAGSGQVAHGLYYAPAHPEYVGPDGEAPPLLVKVHGGPTGAARSQLQLGLRYWTSRGFAVVDLNYRGSIGYGRPYRDALQGQWGIADVEDCVAAAKYLADRGDVDGSRLAIAGGSAGGFTVLAALAFHDAFAVGASRYGVADLRALAEDTHKFEARYLDGLIGRWPEDAAIYDQRSPINHTAGLSCPMIILQGGEDYVVPQNQAELMVAALKEKGLAHSYVLFPDEGHGFRKAENIVTALEAELSFFGQTLGFEPADDITPVEVIT